MGSAMGVVDKTIPNATSPPEQTPKKVRWTELLSEAMESKSAPVTECTVTARWTYWIVSGTGVDDNSIWGPSFDAGSGRDRKSVV